MPGTWLVRKACVTRMNECYHALLQMPYFKGDSSTQSSPSKEGPSALVQNPHEKQFKKWPKREA